MDLNHTVILMDGKEIKTIQKLEWKKIIKQKELFEEGEIISISKKKMECIGKIILKSWEKFDIAKKLQSEDGTLTGKICDIIGQNIDGRYFILKKVQFEEDGYQWIRGRESDVEIQFKILKGVEYKQEQ